MFNIATGLCICCVAVPCAFTTWLVLGEGGRLWRRVGAEALGEGLLLALGFWCVARVFEWLVARFTRRASTPLPVPPVDPLAHYREGPTVECPRHPFAR